MIRFKRTKSLCKECPLNNEKKVLSLVEISKPKIALMGEAPGADECASDEEDERRPFIGSAGKWLKSAVAQTGLLFHATYRLNVINCRPPKNDIGSFEAIEAVECCKPGLQEELSYMKKLGIKVIVPLGNTACSALSLEGKISKIRGSVYYQNETVILPTYHPSFIMRGMLKEEGTWIADLVKARDLSLRKYVPPKENFNLFPSLNDLKKFHKFCMRKKPLLGVDIETTSLNPYFSKIVVVGLSWSPEDAISIPFMKKGGERYWNGDTPIVEKLLGEILKKCPTLFQNALFDVRHLEEKGFEVGNIEHDVLLMHAAIHPELPHNLGYITSIYGTTPYWKEEFAGRNGSILEMDDTVLRTYNLRDVVVLHQVLPELKKDLKETDTEDVYKNISMRLVRPVMSMTQNGICIDQREQAKFKKSLQKESKKLLGKLLRVTNLPANFNFSSGLQMRAFLYGTTVPENIERALKEYEDDSKRRRNTKKFRVLVATRTLYENIKPIIKLPCLSRTDGGDPAVDEEAFLKIQQLLNNRLNAVLKLTRRTPKHDVEIQNIKKLQEFIVVHRKYAENAKLLSTYADLPVAPDGRVHSSYLIHGTRNSRLSSREPNLQNIPLEARMMFHSEEGWTLVAGDYTNLEMVVLGYIADDDVIIDIFKSGRKIHNENAKLFCQYLPFEVTPEDEFFEVVKRGAKTHQFGRNYGGTVKGIYKKVLLKVPELTISFQQFEQLDKAYLDAHPKQKIWADALQADIVKTKTLRSPFGRIRIFLGTEDEIKREALNCAIQSPAGDIKNKALIGIYETVKKNKYPAKLVLDVHDDITMEVRDDFVDEWIPIQKKIMEQKHHIGKYNEGFPVAFKIGKCWGEMKSYEA